MKHYNEAAAWYDILSQGISGEKEFYLKEAKKTRGKVLEVACGTGRVYLDLVKAGVDAYGFDLSKDMLDVLREKAGKARVTNRLKVKAADMRTFRYPFKFDLIIIPYRAFLHLETREDQKKCLINVRKHLKKGGRLILNFFDPRLDFLCEIKRISISETDDPKSGKRVKVENYSRYDLVNQHIYAYHRFVNPPPGLPKDKMGLSLCYIFPREFMNMLELCGFRKWELFGGFDRKPHTSHGQELVWVAYR